NADWVELSILVEEAWRAVAPPRVLRGEGASAKTPRTARAARVTTDAKVAREALARLSEICLALPDVQCEREARHATFRARNKKVFAYFLDNHHGDGKVAVCLKGDRRENARLVEASPDRFYSPAYIGSRGYLGVRLDTRRVDWKDVAVRVDASYRAATRGR
ncbi:MAG TPA: MmcQ/YjbR family DNA-binding protein, partial [Polyangiaceae bacterium]|nr:MmcQ/YjbR family DNA-binding protein [Polyangiaceae bacterium]